jgi:hypothetical protein
MYRLPPQGRASTRPQAIAVHPTDACVLPMLTFASLHPITQLLEVVCVAFEPMAVEDVFSIVGMASLSLHARSNILAKLSAVLVTLRGKFVPYVLRSMKWRALILSCSSVSSLASCFVHFFPGDYVWWLAQVPRGTDVLVD